MNEVPHYNAFISYRHHPRDIAVAEAIHKGLERFKVPASLKKQGKKIDRIFRDKEELPITSSLTDTITTALRCSDYQIVICSTHLKDSYWVQREIETFLQTHTKDQILTVIVDGEPADVIPEILTYREVTNPITGETVREPLEPLSCDWRLPKRKAMKTELPRLAAVLLGCTYNDLIQRQKQYQMRRLAVGAGAGMAASLALAGYFLYTGIQIQENLNESLRNQSHYLASTSEDLFENGDRLTAIALALEALPREDGARPYVIEAERALSEALLLYQPESSFIATQAFTDDYALICFTLSPDGSILYTENNRNTITAWDTDSGSKLGTIHTQIAQQSLKTDREGNLVMQNQDNGLCLRSYAPDGSIRWESVQVSGFAFTQDYSLILAYHAPLGEPIQFMTIDPDTGAMLSGPTRLFPNTDTATYGGINGFAYYTDHLYPLALEDRTADKNPYHCTAYNPRTGTLLQLVTSPNPIEAMTVTPDGYILVASDVTFYDNEDLSDWREISIELHCFRPDGSRLWTTPINGYRNGRIRTMEPIPDSDLLMVQCDNGLYVLSSTTGDVVSRYIAPAFPVAVEPTDEGATVIFQDGNVVWLDYATGGVHQTAFRVDTDITNVQVNHGIYTMKGSTPTLLRYTSTCDDRYGVLETIPGLYLNLYTEDMLTGDGCMVVTLRNTLRYYDLEKNTLLWAADLPDSVDLLGISQASGKLYAQNGEELYCYDTHDGSRTDLTFPTKFWAYCEPTVVEDHLYYLDTSRYSEDKLYLVDWDLTHNTCTEYPFPASHISRDPAIICYADDTQVLVRGKEGHLCRLQLSDGSCQVLDRNVPEHPAVLVEGDSLTFAAEQEIVVKDENMDTQQTIPLPDTAAVSLFRTDGRLWVLCMDEMVYCYNQEGNLETVTPAIVYNNYFNYANSMYNLAIPITWAETPDGDVFLNIFSAGNLLTPGSSIPRYQMNNILHYHPANNTLYGYAANGDSILTYDLLSTREVIARGREVLGDFTLTEDQQTAYGLN